LYFELTIASKCCNLLSSLSAFRFACLVLLTGPVYAAEILELPSPPYNTTSSDQPELKVIPNDVTSAILYATVMVLCLVIVAIAACVMNHLIVFGIVAFAADIALTMVEGRTDVPNILFPLYAAFSPSQKPC
jgi:hypothetical protein